MLASVLPAARAEVSLAPPFTDHAVIQRDALLPVWGWSDQLGATVTVTYGGQTKQTLVNQSGLWRADLDPMPANATGGDLVVNLGAISVTCHDVVVGEVWLASGQSNMEWGLGSSHKLYEVEKAKPANPLIRHLRVEHVGADLPVGHVKTDGWQAAGPDTVGGFTAVGYFFAQAVSQKLGVPVGIINASWGGTPIESWMPEPVLRASSTWPALQAEWQEALKVWPQKYAAQPGLEAAWQKAQQEFETKGTPVTMEWPRPPMGPGSGFSPARLYNGMISPFVPYALRGALWYQGESNVGRAKEYAELLPAMIQSWRSAWLVGDFPFLVVQLPNFVGWDKEKGLGRSWAYQREAQQQAMSHVRAGGLAITIDNDEPDNLHPQDKRPVGARLALIAEAKVYGLPVEGAGPTFASAVREGAAMRVKFTHAAGLATHDKPVTGFEIAGTDKVFHPATAHIDSESVLVSAPEVPEPVAVRYAFTNAPAASLYNTAGLPAAPFRTDDW